MRHQIAGKKLNRDTDHRRALIKNLVRSLVEHEAVVTTKAKAEVLRRSYEKLMTKAKKGNLSSQRDLQRVLQDRKLVQKMVRKATGDFKDRSSGFVRLIPQMARRGDAAMLTKVELVVKSVVETPVKEKKLMTKKNSAKTAGEKPAKEKKVKAVK